MMYSLVFVNSNPDTEGQLGVGNICWRQVVNLNSIAVAPELSVAPKLSIVPRPSIAPKSLKVPVPSVAPRSSLIVPRQRYSGKCGISSVGPKLLSYVWVARRAARRCWVADCPNAKQRRGIKTKLFCFPRNAKRCREWLKAIGDRNLARTTWLKLTSLRYVCLDHFLPSYITPSGRPAHNAIPTIFRNERPVLPQKCFHVFEESIPEARLVPDEELIINDHDYLGNALHKGNPEENTEVSCIQHVSDEEEDSDLEKSDADLGKTLPIIVTSSATSDHTYVAKPSLSKPKKQGDSKHNQNGLPNQRVVESNGGEFNRCESGQESLESLIFDMQLVNKTQTLQHASDHLKYPVMSVYNATPTDKAQDTPLPPNIAKYLPVRKEPPKGATNNHALEDMRNELCRLCGQKKSILIPIFGSTNPELKVDMSLSSKIETYLPFKVQMDDPLPYQICELCNEKLNHWHELYLTCVAADTVLWKTFGGECDIPSWRVTDTAANRNQEKIIKGVVSILSPVDSRSDQEMTSVQCFKELGGASILDKEEEEQKIICTVCGMNSIARTLKEDNSFNEEFDKFFTKIPCMAFRCCYCYEYFKNKNERKQHTDSCGELPAICEVCGKEIRHRKYCLMHWRKSHDPTSSYKTKKKIHFSQLCDICGRCYKTPEGYKWHMKVTHEHDQSAKYCCEFCCIVFVCEEQYKDHKRKHERKKIKSVFQIRELLQPEPPTKYSCPVCNKSFCDKLSLVVHLTAKNIMKCSLCRKKVSSEKWLLLHKCNQWMCQYCSNIFNEKGKWIVHERVHTGEKPFKCKACDKSFRTKVGRKRHEETHSVAIHECRYCDKKFRNKYVYKDHTKCHEGQVFLCYICDKNFTGRNGLRKHTQVFHNTCVLTK